MTTNKAVPFCFFQRPAAKVARELLGKRLVRPLNGVDFASTIVETEAYEGKHDLASHSSKGRNAHTEVMFGPPGRFYVYRIYGLHWMLNIITGGADEAAAVLIRSTEDATGPGRVTAALKVDGAFHGMEAVRASGLWFKGGSARRNLRIQATPRVGVDYAGPIWSQKKLRFVLR